MSEPDSGYRTDLSAETSYANYLHLDHEGRHLDAIADTSPNEFERGKPGMEARYDAEAAIERLRHRGGVS